MELNLRGKTALVTGASKGIGLGIAHLLAEEGCSLHLVSRTESALQAARQAIQSRHNVGVTLHPLDLSVSSSVDRLVEACGADTDILVNNAGAIPGGSLDMIDERRWREAWDLKVFGYVNMTRAFLATMQGRGGGVIVNIIGAAGEKHDYSYVAGSAGNASLIAFTRAVGSRSIDQGVRVVGINPGATETDRIVTLMRTRAEREFGDASRWLDYMKKLPLGRAGKPEEIASLTAFLASDRAAYISGVVYTVDGGAGSRT